MPSTWLAWIFSFLSVGSIRFADLFSLPLLHSLDTFNHVYSGNLYCLALVVIAVSEVHVANG